MRLFIITLFTFVLNTAFAQDLNVGLRFQKTQNMYWENGISIQYSFANFKPKQFYVGFDYYSSRFGTAISSNAIKQDNFLLSASWYFFKEKPFHLLGRLNVGWLVADYEYDIFESVPNTAFLFSPELGVCYDFKNLPIKLNVGMGYFFNFQEDFETPGTFQPLYYHFTAYYKIFHNRKKD